MCGEECGKLLVKVGIVMICSEKRMVVAPPLELISQYTYDCTLITRAAPEIKMHLFSYPLLTRALFL